MELRPRFPGRESAGSAMAAQYGAAARRHWSGCLPRQQQRNSADGAAPQSLSIPQKYGFSLRSLGFRGKREPQSCSETMHDTSPRMRSKVMTTLANKIALVTGASRGMGRATALALGAAGARIIVHYGRNADEANAVVDQIRANGGQADAVAADLSAPDGAHVLAAEVR